LNYHGRRPAPPALDFFKSSTFGKRKRPGCVLCGGASWSTDGVESICYDCYWRIRPRQDLWPAWWWEPHDAPDRAAAHRAWVDKARDLEGPRATRRREELPPTYDDAQDERHERPDARIADAVASLLWFPPSPPPAPLTDGTGNPPDWWDAAGAARRIRQRLGGREPAIDPSAMTQAELAAALRQSAEKARTEKEEEQP